jgi:anti-sigma factor RsiW
MKCVQVRENLPELFYGDLPPDEAAAVQKHLQACPACRQEEAALRQVRRLLDAVPVPTVLVDLAQLYRRAAERQQRRVRRWRRTAVLCLGAAAAVLLFAVMPRFEVRLENHQLVLRWANPPLVEAPASPPAPVAQASPAVRGEPNAIPQLEEQVQVLAELVHDQREEIAQLRARLGNLGQQVAAGNQRWLTIEGDIAALSGSQRLTRKKGELP